MLAGIITVGVIALVVGLLVWKSRGWKADSDKLGEQGEQLAIQQNARNKTTVVGRGLSDWLRSGLRPKDDKPDDPGAGH